MSSTRLGWAYIMVRRCSVMHRASYSLVGATLLVGGVASPNLRKETAGSKRSVPKTL